MANIRFSKFVGTAFFIALFTSVSFFISCKKMPGRDQVNPEIENADINQWILDTMRYYYYWTQSIPKDNRLDMNLSPDDFFNSLLNKPTDRFSWIQQAEDLKNELNGVIKTSGIEVGFFSIGENGAGISVKYVLEGSPADALGVKRGDIFTRVNGIALTTKNGYVQGYEPLFGNDTFTLTKGILSEDIISEGETITLTPVEGYQEKAIQMEDIIRTDNGTKVAYLFYNRFLNQPQELVDAFVRFKEAGVTELIIDERYNGGGSVDIAALLSAMIHQGFDINSPFIQFDFNDHFRDETLTYADLFGEVNEPLVSSVNLGLNRVFILATENSASASELLINNLKPFLSVVHIGGTTYGKDAGSITFENSSPKFAGANDWGIQPIVLKYKNKDGGGDFVTGLVPDHVVKETVPFAPMGSSSDPLIGKALGIIDPSMQTTAQRQMRTVDGRRSPATALSLLEKANRDLFNPRPLDVTELLKEHSPQRN